VALLEDRHRRRPRAPCRPLARGLLAGGHGSAALSTRAGAPLPPLATLEARA
jgi:hypothetical protein